MKNGVRLTNRMPVGRGLIIDDDGNPLPVNNPSFTKESARSFMNAVLGTDYEQRRELDGSITPEDFEFANITKGEAIIRRLINRATYGDYDSAKLVLEYVIGKPTQSHEHEHKIKSFSDFAMECITADAVTVNTIEEDDDIGI